MNTAIYMKECNLRKFIGADNHSEIIYSPHVSGAPSYATALHVKEKDGQLNLSSDLRSKHLW